MINNLIKHCGDGANSVWGIDGPVTLCLNLSVPGDTISIMGEAWPFQPPNLSVVGGTIEA